MSKKQNFYNIKKPVAHCNNLKIAKAGRMLYKIRANIVGGNKASKGMFPWQVAIESGDGSAFCGGSLITLNAVLTAGHCVKGLVCIFFQYIVW